MVNVLIADDNIDYAIYLMNYINKKNEHIKVCNIAKDGKEALELLNNNNNIDVILLDYKMPIYNGDQILNKILDKDIYPKISIIFNDSVHNIKCRINRETNIMYFNCEVEKLKKYFSFSIDTKPKVKTVINTIIKNINIIT